MHNCFENLQWLDLQNNYLVKIHPSILAFKNLKTLYLQGNYINDLQELQLLQELPNLRNLSIHSNPLAYIKDFRLFIIALLPELRKIDTVLVTHKERDNAYFLTSVYKEKKLPMYKGDDSMKPPPEYSNSQSNKNIIDGVNL